MRKMIISLLLLGFIFVALGTSLAYANPPQPRRRLAAISAEIKRVQDYNANLRRKLEQAKDDARRRELNRMIKIYNRRLESLETELGINPLPPQLLPGPKKVQIRPEPIVAPRTIGISAGLVANIPAIVGEVRIREPFELRAISLKIGLGYAKGKDRNGADKQNVPLLLTAIYPLTLPGTPGINPYFGLGLNFDLWAANSYGTGNAGMGSVGADILFGLEGSAGAGEIFAELSYDILKPESSNNDYRGAGFLVGYRCPW